MDNLDFSEEEIRQQLVQLGYTDVPKNRLREFKQDLEDLIQNGGLASASTTSDDTTVNPRPPVFTKEKVGPRDIGTSPGSYFPQDKSRNTQVLSPSAQKDGGMQQHLKGSMTPHTMVPDTHGRRFVTRKVLRKIEGQSVVCDESYYKQDSDQEPLIQNIGFPSAPTASADARVNSRPPAFTKEIVCPSDIGTSPESFLSHGEGRNTQVLSPSARNYGRMQQQNEGSETHHTLEPDTCGRRLIKRKVLRKIEGQSVVCEESYYRQDSDCSSLLQNSLSELHINDSENENDKASVLSDDEMVGISLSSFGSSSTRSTRTRSESDLQTKPKSFIRPVVNQRTIKKMDPVSRYFQYKQLWDGLKLPGERDHRDLRWAIRERLAYQPEAPKAHRTYVANSYVVPTEKKRSALRWEVRNQMAHPDKPHMFTYRF
ncbi:centriolar and ciliogenesis-associated protein HYLS1 isoform X2 [Corythoichthys intestinalis]|uniref:centriolar and ciliogenesis-associated protein HYLS1 isoform X2 n=1 Tax=Corythoichthys intestinalis TaxID=161448 RepID=UPI0025A5B49D|nr:centriolar and ciliogenesis-associated protein HYLS1 isoform X2 [Corythoichthys intestinalis]